MSNDNGHSTALTRPSDSHYNQAGAAIERRGFGTHEMEVSRETTGTAAAEHAKALVQARFIMALQRPRDIEDVRVRLLKHCKRPRFAEVAEYSKPVSGQAITGPSIRFVETALQEYGNVTIDPLVVYDDDEKRVIRVTVADLERNIAYTEDATIEKFVERKSAAGGEVIGERKKKNGDIVYKIRATEDDFANKHGAAVSKKIRNLGLRILPADIVDEAMWECSETRRRQVKDDPDAAIRKMADAFARINITPAALKEYLGHELGAATPDEIDALRKVGIAIKDGETTWQATLDARKAERGEASVSVDKTADALKAKLATAPAKDKAPHPRDVNWKEEGAKAGEAAAKAASAKPRSVSAMEARRKAIATSITWARNGDRHAASFEDLELAVEQVGPEQWGWWVMRNGEDLATGEAGSHEMAKGLAVDAASKA